MTEQDDRLTSFRRLGTKYLLSVMAACVAEFVTYPLDLTKTRLQIQGMTFVIPFLIKSVFNIYVTLCKLIGEVASNNYRHTGQKRGMFRTAFGICQEEGISRLWQGISPSLARHVIYSGVRITLYEKMREIITTNSIRNDKDNSGSLRKDHNLLRTQMSLHHRIICGMSSGAIGQFCASPADLIKVRMQMQGRHQVMIETVTKGGESISSKASQNMMQILVDVIKTGGVKSLWKGK